MVISLRKINTDLNRSYRNDLNQNFADIENEINKQSSDIARVEAESKERDNLLAGTDVQAVIDRINTSADNADVQAQHAKKEGDYAKIQGDYAKEQGVFAQSKGTYAEEKAVLADEAAAAAIQEASNLSQLKIDVTTATQEANVAAANANTQATYAQEQGDYAKQEADRIAGMDVASLEQTVNNHIENTAIHHTHNNKIYLDKFSEDLNGHLLYYGMPIASGSVLNGLYREVANLKLYQDVNERIENGVVFGDTFIGQAMGATFDEVNSNVVIDTVNNRMGFGVELQGETVTVNNATVINQPYSTAGNGGRKLVRLSNGKLISGVKGTNDVGVHLYGSDDNGVTWSFLRTYLETSQVFDVSISENKDGNILVVANRLFNSVYYVSTQLMRSNGSNIGGTVIDSNQTALGNVSLDIDPTNGHLHATWASKNSTYPNSFNVRCSKSTDGGVTWSVVEQATSGSNNYINPSIVLANGNPVILCEVTNTNSIVARYKSDNGAWSYSYVYQGSTYVQSSPSAVIDNDGVIANIWHGYDASHPSINYIRFSKSLDDAVSWSPMQKLVPGQNGTLTVDKNNKYIIIYEDGGVIKRIESADKGDNWSIPVTVGTGTNPSSIFDPTFSLEFTTPPVIFQTPTIVIFSGEWTQFEEIPLTEATAVYQLPTSDEVIVWVQRDNGMTVRVYLNDVEMTKETEENEDQFHLASPGSVETELKLVISRPTINDDFYVKKILGGVAK